ncbi:trypsin-like peptidase domain-containing protein [Pyxidicoccus sp. 3LG]
MDPSDYKRILDIKRQAEADLLKLPGVHGVSIGYKVVGDQRTDELAIVVHVSNKVAEEQLAPEERIPRSIQGVSTDVIAHPQPGAQADSSRYRPLKGGCQLEFRDWNGTLGAIVKRQSDGVFCLLTNQHVLPSDGTVYQPSTQSGNEIADVANHVLSKKVDGAIAKLRAGVNWTNWVLGAGAIQGTYTVSINDITGLGYPVQKYGRTTGWTHGRVTQLHYSGKRKDGWEFEDQLFISSDGGAFSSPGDSGSVAVDGQGRIVGLLWGGTGTDSIASPIADVESELEVKVVNTSMPPLRLVHEGHGDSGWVWYASFDGATWSKDQLIPNASGAYGTSGPPSVVAYREKLYCIREGRDDSGWVWCATFDGTTWSPGDQLIPSASGAYGTTGSPAAAVFRGKLYCVREGRDDSGWVWCATFDGTNWSGDQLISTSGGTLGTSGPPTLVVFQNRLYCIREGRSDRGWLWCTSTTDGITWTTDSLIPSNGNAFGTSGPPALATYRGLLYCVRQGRDDSGWVWCATFDGTNWSGDQLIPNGSDAYGVTGSPALVVYNDILYCIREGRSNSGQLWVATYDGTTWSTDRRLPNDEDPYGTSGRPGLAVLP